MRVFWLTGAVASLALLVGCQTYAGTGPHGRHGPHDQAAQADGPHGGHGPGMHEPGMHDHAAMHGHAMMGAPDPAATQAWLDRAKAEIAVTPEQESAWSAYSAAINANRTAMAEHRPPTPQAAEGAHLPDRMQAHLGMMSAHLASMQQIQAAAQELYSKLSEEQRARADQALAMHGRHGHRRGRD